MNDTHGVQGEGWIGFDLDGTLAVYDKREGIDHIGEPVKPMVELIKKLHDEGKKVKILTARVAPRENPEKKNNPGVVVTLPEDVAETPWREKYLWTAREFVQEWCYKNLGFVPEITHEKDHLMLELYDDRVKQVIPNKGILVEDMAPRVEVTPVIVRHIHHSPRKAIFVATLTSGMLFGFAIAHLLGLWKWAYEM